MALQVVDRGTESWEDPCISLFQCIIIVFETWQSFEPSSSNSGGDRYVRLLRFCWEFYSQQLLFETFSDIIRTFSSIHPKSELTFLFQYMIECTLILQTFNQCGTTNDHDIPNYKGNPDPDHAAKHTLITSMLDNAKCKYTNLPTVFVANGVTQLKFAISSVGWCSYYIPGAVLLLRSLKYKTNELEKADKTNYSDGIKTM